MHSIKLRNGLGARHLCSSALARTKAVEHHHTARVARGTERNTYHPPSAQSSAPFHPLITCAHKFMYVIDGKE